MSKTAWTEKSKGLNGASFQPKRWWHGKMQTWNRPILTQVTTLLAAAESPRDVDSKLGDGGDAVSEAGDGADARSESGAPAKPKAAEPTPRSRSASKQVVRSQSKESLKSHKTSKSVATAYSVAPAVRPKDFTPPKPETPRWKQEHLIRMKHKRQQREEDLKKVRDKCDRDLMNRDQKFELMLEDITDAHKHSVQAGALLSDEEDHAQSKKEALYEKYEKDVDARVRYQLLKCMHPSDHTIRQEDWPGGSALRAEHDPMKSELCMAEQEETFKRQSNMLLFKLDQRRSGMRSKAEPMPENMKRRSLSSIGQNKNGGEGLSVEELETVLQVYNDRLTTRPTLDSELWDQNAYPTTSYGLCANTGRREDGTFHTSKRRGAGAHIPKDEHDGGLERAGVHCGLGKKRAAHINMPHMGVLEGRWAKRGQGYKFKDEHGGSHAVPMGDHYRYEKSVVVVDAEFPQGKRVYKYTH